MFKTRNTHFKTWINSKFLSCDKNTLYGYTRQKTKAYTNPRCGGKKRHERKWYSTQCSIKYVCTWQEKHCIIAVIFNVWCYTILETWHIQYWKLFIITTWTTTVVWRLFYCQVNCFSHLSFSLGITKT